MHVESVCHMWWHSVGGGCCGAGGMGELVMGNICKHVLWRDIAA